LTRRRIHFRFVLVALSAAVLCAVIILVVWPVSPTVAILGSVVLASPGRGLPSSFHVRQSIPMDQGMVVYYTFDHTDIQGTPGKCRFVSYVRREAIGWQTVESYGGCQPVGVGSGPFTAVSRGWDIPGEAPWSEVHGVATGTGVDSLRVAWSDGMIHTAAVVDGHYLVTRSGRADVMQVETLDRAGMIVDTYNQVTSP
jgi:hypothetical protein